jgi:hypothetical protein
MKAFVALLMLVACGPGHIPDPVPATAPNARLVQDVLFFASRLSWSRSPWYRELEDVIDWPRRVVLANDRSVCFVPERDVYTPLPNQFYQCAGRWRTARP